MKRDGELIEKISSADVVNTVREPMLVLDADMRVVSANRSFYRTFRVDEEQTEGKLIYDLGNGQWDIPALKELLEKLLPQNKKLDDFEITHDFPDIGRCTMLLNARRIYKDSQKTDFILLAIEDITKQKQAYDKLAASEEKFSLLANESLAAIYIVQDGLFKYANPRLAEIFGYTADELVDRHGPKQLTVREDWPLVKENIRKRIQGEVKSVHYTFSGITKNRQVIDIEVYGLATHYRDKPALIGTLLDITEKKRAEAALVKLSCAVESAGEAIITTDKNGVIDYVNPAFEQLTGYSAAEAIGKTPRIIKSGKQDHAFYQQMWSTILGGETWQEKIVDKKKSGELYPAILTISPFNTGEQQGFVGIQTDLTDYAAMEKQFLQAQKMEAIGTLVGGIAHDFNNVLAAITGNLFLAKSNLSKQKVAREKIANCEQMSNRAAGMIQQLLTFSRHGEVEKTEISLTPLLKETVKFLRTAVPENIAIKLDIEAGDFTIEGSPSQLHQVLMNLINNARDALEGRDEPAIEISLQRARPAALVRETDSALKQGEYAHLTVKDNGCGISEEELPHIFEPFFTTKEPGKGTGLGLAMVYGAVQSHQGHIDATSNDGGGLSFHVYLPLTDKVAASVASGENKRLMPGQGECILLADDEAGIRDMLAEVLISLNYRVISATDGEQALERFAENSHQIDLALLDVVMPHRSGEDVARAIRATHSDLPIVLLTGYDRGDALHDYQPLGGGGGGEVLKKPVEMEALSVCLRKLLAG